MKNASASARLADTQLEESAEMSIFQIHSSNHIQTMPHSIMLTCALEMLHVPSNFGLLGIIGHLHVRQLGKEYELH